MPGPLLLLHVPVPTLATPVNVNGFPTPIPHTLPPLPALATGCTSLRITTSSKLAVHVPLLIVHRKVAVVPATRPVTPVVALLLLLITTAGPLTWLHEPTPTVALLALIVKPLVLHWKISVPALDRKSTRL